MQNIKFPTSRGKNRPAELTSFASALIDIDRKTGFKVSSRGWSYQLEGLGLITKGEFDRVQRVINECRKGGYLPIDFVAEEGARQFNGIYDPTTATINEYISQWINAAANAADHFNPDFWADEQYYIQMLVEKTDLVSLFGNVCEQYHIPIATSKGWSSISQRAELVSRFKLMEEYGHIPVLLYCGDHDPVGLGISDTIIKNLKDIELGTGWSPNNLIVDRFGLNYDFIIDHNLMWIDNLETGSGKQADESKAMVKRYVDQFGRRKVEANAIVVDPAAGQRLCVDAIEKYLGQDVITRWDSIKSDNRKKFDDIQSKTGVQDMLMSALDLLRTPPKE